MFLAVLHQQEVLQWVQWSLVSWDVAEVPMGSPLANIRFCSACSLSERAADRITLLCLAGCFQETCMKTFETRFPLPDLAETQDFPRLWDRGSVFVWYVPWHSVWFWDVDLHRSSEKAAHAQTRLYNVVFASIRNRDRYLVDGVSSIWRGWTWGRRCVRSSWSHKQMGGRRWPDETENPLGLIPFRQTLLTGLFIYPKICWGKRKRGKSLLQTYT